MRPKEVKSAKNELGVSNQEFATILRCHVSLAKRYMQQDSSKHQTDIPWYRQDLLRAALAKHRQSKSL